MKIRLTKITVKELFDGYDNKFEDGVTGFGGKLDIRPKFQREFVYSPQQRDAVIDSITKGFPISVMYWLKTPEDTYELMDGQQRTISICEYVEGAYAFNNEYFFKLPQERQEQILNYPLLVYVVEGGTDEENLAWFRKINTAGEKLTNQEIRNAIYVGPWVTDAKKYFSKSFCAAIKLGEDYMTGSPIRQDYLETVLGWASDGKIDEYMRQHCKDENAEPLWKYFETIVDWVKKVFPTYRKEMKGVDWGTLYNKYKDVDTTGFQAKADALYADEEVETKKGIYTYLFDGDTKALGLATFPKALVRDQVKAQNGLCAICGTKLANNSVVAHRLDKWEDGGRIDPANCKVICSSCDYMYMHTDLLERKEMEGINTGSIHINKYHLDHKRLLTEGIKSLPDMCERVYVGEK